MAEFWYYETRLNVIPFDTLNKKPVLYEYSQYQNKRIPEAEFKRWIEEGLFEKGMAIFPGRIYDDSKNELHWVSIDLDSKQAILEFCNIFGDRVTISELSKRFLVEQHLDNLDRAHVSLISPLPFPNKGSDTKIGLEVKSNGEHGIMFVAPSLHKNGSPYKIIGTDEPSILTLSEATMIIDKIKQICKKYGLDYGAEKVTGLKDKRIVNMVKNLKIDENFDFRIRMGERNTRLFAIARSILYHHYERGNKTLEPLREFFIKINEQFCDPEELPNKEITTIWNSALNYSYATQNESLDTDLMSKEKDVKNKSISESIIQTASEKILSEFKFITLEETKEILWYDKGVYKRGGNIVLEKAIEKYFEYHISNKHIAEIKGHIMRQTYHKKSELDVDLNIINLSNGLYHIDINELRPHTPEYLSIIQSPIKHDPNSTSRLFGKFLKDVLFPSEIRTLVEAMAYTFYRDNPYEYFFKLFGYGSNGKSVVTSFLTALHGEQSVSNVPILSLVNNRFALSDLEHKNINIDTELTGGPIKDTSILKKLTGGKRQLIRIERKNKNAYDTIIHAKLFINTNSLIETIDQTDAYFRREIIITFPNKFEGESCDHNLLNKLTSVQEMSGIFNILMKALRNILSNNGIYLNENSIEARRLKTERAINSIRAFLEEAVSEESVETDSIPKNDLYKAYVAYCKKYKIVVKSIELFGKELKKMNVYREGRIGSKDNRKRCWIGIRLK
jgi:putative DNA primase/helicase